jgi:predicted ATPase/DNA-binding SARP family transcriptional activator/DNA-binding CsgD family transcriptional regulator
MPEAVRVRMLGGFSVSVGLRTIEENQWRLRKAGHLIKLLALDPGHRLEREQVMDVLWPDLSLEAAYNNLRYALHVARRTLEPDPDLASRYLQLQGNQVALYPGGSLWVDVEAFEDAAATAHRARDPTTYRAALDLYAGDLLPWDRYEPWAEDRRERLRRTYLALLVELAGLHEERKEYGLAIEALRRVLASEPTHEGAHVGLMRLYALCGQRREALGQYERLLEVLSREFGEEPGAASRRLHEQIVAGTFPPSLEDRPPEEPTPNPHNLPAAASSFVGREREMLEVKRLLSTTQLLTFTGAGGSGKTRLALEMAKDLVGAYPDGAWLVELAGLSEGAPLVPQAVAAALNVREQPGRPLTATLVEALRSKRMLMVLDNCEHLVDACARLVGAILGSCPHVRVVVTSRQALGVAGEATWQVASLAVPDDVGHLPAMESLSRYEAVRLFVERARSRLSTFDLTSGNARAVVEVCRRLEGIPLAIELAAAQVGRLSVEQMAARLGSSLKLLTGGGRTAPPRQQTMRATLAWSHELLSEPERKLFGRLSVFAGGCTLEAAEVVGGAGDGVEPEDVLELLSGLVDKSLVAEEASGNGATRIKTRFKILEPVRQYARERLEESGEADAIQRRHAAWFLALAAQAESGLREQGAWLERLETEHDNLRAALQWSLDPEAAAEPEERAGLGLRLAAALAQGRFWSAYGLSEGLGWLERGLARSSSSPPSVRIKALNEAGWLAAWQGDYEKGVPLLEESFAISKELEDKPIVAASLTQLGVAVTHQGDHGRVEALREEAEALRRELSDPHAIAHLLVFLGLAALDAGDYERLVALYEESLDLFREVGDLRGIGICLNSMGLAALDEGDYERAAALLEESLHVLRELRDKVGTIYCLLGVAGVASSQGRPARAARLWGAAEALQEDVGLLLSPFHHSHYDYEGHLATARSLLDEAAWQAAWAQGRAMTPEQAIEYALGTEEPPTVPTVLAAQQEPPVASRQPVVLSRREQEVALLIGRGLANRRIAEELGISKRTVDNHVAKILRKLGLSSRSQVAESIRTQRLRELEQD